MPPVPIVMCGKFAEHAANFSTLMLPEYDVIHHFQSTPECTSNLPLVMAGKPTKNQSGVGSGVSSNSNADSPQIPKAMFVGGGFSDDELQEMLQIPESKRIPWLAADPNRKDEVREKGLDAMMAGIVERAKGKLREVGVGEGGKEVMGGLWRY